MHGSAYRANIHFGSCVAPDSGHGPVCAVPASGPPTGEIYVIHEDGDRGWLIGAEKGIFRIDPATGSVHAVSGPSTGAVLDISRGQRRLTRIDPGVSPDDPPNLKDQDRHDVAFSMRKHFKAELLRSAGSSRGEPRNFLYFRQQIGIPTGAIIGYINAARELSDGGWLVAASGGLLLISP